MSLMSPGTLRNGRFSFCYGMGIGMEENVLMTSGICTITTLDGYPVSAP
jgi:hypothetical protein